MGETLSEQVVEAPAVSVVDEPFAPRSMGEALAAVTARYASSEPVISATAEPAFEGEQSPVVNADAFAEAERVLSERLDAEAQARADVLFDEEIEQFADELGVDAQELATLARIAQDPAKFAEEYARERQRAEIAAEDHAADVHMEGDRVGRELIAGWTNELGDLDADAVLAAAEAMWPQVARDVDALRLQFGADVDNVIGTDEDVAAAVVRMAAEQQATAAKGEQLTWDLLADLQRLYGPLSPAEEAMALDVAGQALPRFERVHADPRRAAEEALKETVQRMRRDRAPRTFADLHETTRFYAQRMKDEIATTGGR